MLLKVLVLGAVLGCPLAADAAEETHVTAGAAGTYPASTSFAGVPLQGIDVGFGATVTPEGFGLGNVSALLRGVAVLGVSQTVAIVGHVTAGSRTAVNVAILTGTATVDLGDGTPPAADIPFTLTLTKDPATNQGTIGLATGLGNLPNATLNEGSVSIRTVAVD
jgi:hypothetical protein